MGTQSDIGSAVYLYVGSSAPTFEKLTDITGSDAVITTDKTLEQYGETNYSRTNGSAQRDTWVAGDKFYAILVSADKKSYYVNPTGKTLAAKNIYEPPNSGTQVSVNNTSDHTYTAFAGGGGGEEVPEPTSGLLLLVGGALLGLRRKRA